MTSVEGSFDVDLTKLVNGTMSRRFCGVITTVPFLCEVSALTSVGEGPAVVVRNSVSKYTSSNTSWYR